MMGDSVFSSIRRLLAGSDEQLMWRVKMEDDPEAFGALVARWQTRIQNLCTRMTGDSHRGEDLAQETFARLFARRGVYESSAKFSTFLWRVASNLCYDELRRIRRRREHPFDRDHRELDDVEFAIETPGPDTQCAEQEQAEAVRGALQQLAEPYRVVVVLRHYEGLKFREIAAVLDIPEGTVKSRMAEGLHQLGLILHPVLQEEDHNVTPPSRTPDRSGPRRAPHKPAETAGPSPVL
jgi:RNA polymerase sigma-70 factor, ECF subfamily